MAGHDYALSEGSAASDSSWPTRRLRRKQAASNHALLVARVASLEEECIQWKDLASKQSTLEKNIAFLSSKGDRLSNQVINDHDVLMNLGLRLQMLGKVYVLMDWQSVGSLLDKQFSQPAANGQNILFGGGAKPSKEPEAEMSPQRPKIPSPLQVSIKEDANDSVSHQNPTKSEPHFENHIAVELFGIFEHYSHASVQTDFEDVASVRPSQEIQLGLDAPMDEGGEGTEESKSGKDINENKSDEEEEGEDIKNTIEDEEEEEQEQQHEDEDDEEGKTCDKDPDFLKAEFLKGEGEKKKDEKKKEDDDEDTGNGSGKVLTNEAIEYLRECLSGSRQQLHQQQQFR